MQRKGSRWKVGDRRDEPGACNSAQARPDPANLKRTNERALRMQSSASSWSELDAVSLARPGSVAVLRAILLFELKRPRQRFELCQIGGGRPADYANRRLVRHAPGLYRERATLIALAQSASVSAATGERLHQAAQMNS
jgi:hypothetical protein